VDSFASVADLITALKLELGGQGGVAVELQNAHFENCIGRALKMMNRYLPGWARKGMDYTPNVYKYEIPYTTLRNFIHITDVNFIRPDVGGTPIQLENPFLLASRQLAPNGMGLTGYGDFALTLAHLSEAEKVFSVTPSWETHWEVKTDPLTNTESRIYALYLKVVDQLLFSPYKVSYVYSFGYDTSDNLLTGIPSIPLTQQDWVTNCALAYAKVTLGRIRSKFKGIPSSDGMSQFPIDGDDLIAEGRQEIETLTQDLKRMHRQQPIALG
jgi:hypothetical protein